VSLEILDDVIVHQRHHHHLKFRQRRRLQLLELRLAKRQQELEKYVNQWL
jgi:hypothetical protein